jgi:hypothetical protein
MAKPKTPEHLQRCEDAAAKLLQGKKKISHADVLRTFRLIKAADWPTQTRPNVAPTANPEVTGLVLGLSPNRQGGCSIAQASQQCPSLTQVVTKWIRDTLPDAAFRYGSIQVNYNYRARKHIDSNNLGPSYIVALGSFEGGQLWTGDRGILDCREKWCLFDGNTEHATEPYSGKDRRGAASVDNHPTPTPSPRRSRRTIEPPRWRLASGTPSPRHTHTRRFSFILFTPDRYNKLTKSICEEAKRLGVTACSTAGVDDKYFSQYRDLAAVDEDDHVAFTEKHHENNPPSFGSGALSVETNGYAAGRGWGWIAWQTGKSGGDKVHTEHFRKNATGIHVVELDVVPPSSSKQVLTFAVREVHRFNLYQDTEQETKRFAKWVDKLPKNTVVGCCITDTAMAKTRPLNSTVYESFRKLGASDSLTLIGYREPFCFLGWKGAGKGKGVYALDAKKQSKQLLRLDAVVTYDKGELAMTWKSSQVKLLEQLPPAKKRRTEE